ncbi:protein of unknown function [Burkholderia multivorans]
MAGTAAKFHESLAIARRIEADPALRTRGSDIKARMKRLWTAMGADVAACSDQRAQRDWRLRGSGAGRRLHRRAS